MDHQFTNEMLATAIKYLASKRQNFHLSLSEYPLDDEHREHINSEIDKLNAVISVLEAEQERRRREAA